MNPNFFWSKILCTKFCCNKFFFVPKNLLHLQYFLTKFFFTEVVLDPNFWPKIFWTTFFWTKFFFDKKFCCAKNSFGQNLFLWTKVFCVPHFSGAKIYFRHNLLGRVILFWTNYLPFQPDKSLVNSSIHSTIKQKNYETYNNERKIQVLAR